MNLERRFPPIYLFIHLFIPDTRSHQIHTGNPLKHDHISHNLTSTPKSLTRNGSSPFSRNRDRNKKTLYSGTVTQVNRSRLHHQHNGRVCPRTTGLKLGLGGSEHSGCALQDALDNPWSLGKAKGPWRIRT